MNEEDVIDNKQQNKQEEEQKTFLFMQMAGLGDIIIASQACQDIKRFYRNSKIIFVVPEGLKMAAEGIKEVDEIYEYDKFGKHKSFWGTLKFIFSIKHKGKIDYSFTTFDTDNSLWLAALLGAREKHTYPPVGFISNLPTFFNLVVHEKDSETNTAEDLQNWVASIFKEFPFSKCLDFKYPDNVKTEIEKKLIAIKAANYPLIALCPCSKSSEKNWSPKEAAQFIELAYTDGRRIIFIGVEKDKWFIDEVKKLTQKPYFDLMGQTNIMEIGALANRVQAFVSVESGAMHIAYACGAPTVCLFFSSQDFYKWAPKEYANTAVLHRPEGISGEKCYEIIKDFLKQQANLQED